MTDFEGFRRERNYRRQQARITERPEGHREVWEELEAREADELKEEVLNAECDDFFSDATRLVASIVQRASSDRQQEISEKLRREMEEFLCESIRHATNMIINLDWKNAQDTRGEENLEPSLKNLEGRELDEFRAAGTARLPDKHFGQDPFGTELDGSRAPVANEPATPPLPARVDPTPVAAEAAAQVTPAPASLDTDRIHLSDSDLEQEEIAPVRMHLSDDELSMAFDSPEPEFEADEFDARIASVAALQRTVPQFDDEEDMPLAAMHPAEVAPEPEAEPEPEPARASAEPEPAAAADSAPSGDRARTQEEIRDALRLLVRQGIMTPEQARAAYRKQTV